MNKDGGLAFSGQRYEEVELANGDIKMELVTYSGMSLRDWFAGMALSGYMVSDLAVNGPMAAQMCYEITDAMLAERDKEANNDEERT